MVVQFERLRPVFPKAWQKLVCDIPLKERYDLVSAFHKRLNDPAPKVHMKAARALSGYAAAIAKLTPSGQLVDAYSSPQTALALARIFNHYCKNNAFLSDNQLLKNIDTIRQAHIPTWIIQGRYDVVTPRNSADDLHKALPEAQYIVVEEAGHSRTEPGITDALIRSTEEFKALTQKQ
jgi:proline iminopeptidase